MLNKDQLLAQIREHLEPIFGYTCHDLKVEIDIRSRKHHENELEIDFIVGFPSSLYKDFFISLLRKYNYLIPIYLYILIC